MATLAGRWFAACIGLLFVRNDSLAGTVLFRCDFEQGDTCGLVQDTTDTPCSPAFQAGCTDGTFRWILHTGKTPTTGTGPETGNRQSRVYLYMESSNARSGNYARLYTTNEQLGGHTGAVCVVLYYHMYSSIEETMGQLSVEYLRNGEPYSVWSISGNQPKKWTKQSVTMDLREGDKIGFTGTLGSTAFSDIGLDDISVEKGSCGESNDQLVVMFETGATTARYTYVGQVGHVIYTGTSSGLPAGGHVRITCDLTYGGDSQMSLSVDISNLFLCRGDSITVANDRMHQNTQCVKMGDISRSISGSNNALKLEFVSHSPKQTSFKVAFNAPREVDMRCLGNYTAVSAIVTESPLKTSTRNPEPPEGEKSSTKSNVKTSTRTPQPPGGDDLTTKSNVKTSTSNPQAVGGDKSTTKSNVKTSTSNPQAVGGDKSTTKSNVKTSTSNPQATGSDKSTTKSNVKTTKTTSHPQPVEGGTPSGEAKKKKVPTATLR